MIHNQIIPIDRLREIVPAAFGEVAGNNVSDRFQVIPTIEILHLIADLGFYPVWARQTRAREENRDVTKHLIRLRHKDHASIDRWKDREKQFSEIVVVNANNGQSTYRIAAGIFRVVCENGMIVADEKTADVKIRHFSKDTDFFKNVKEISARVVENADMGLKQLEEWRQIPLSRDEQYGYAQGVTELLDMEVKPDSLLKIEYNEDSGENLHNVFQRVQAKVIKGGAKRAKTGRATSAIKSIDKDVKMNQALWTFTQKVAAIKS